MILRMAMLGAALVLLATACELEPDKRRAKKACGDAPAAMTGTPSLPPKFPTPNGVTYTAQKDAGPTTIVSGYLPGEIGNAFDAFQKSLATNGYAVTKTDHESVEAEVNYEGGHTTGQVKLLQECRDRTKVTITVRPA
jgi:hypothetical protein